MMLSFRFSRILSTIAYFPSCRPTSRGFLQSQNGSCPADFCEWSGCGANGCADANVPGEQLADAIDRMVGDAAEHLAQIRLRVEFVELCSLNEACRRLRRAPHRHPSLRTDSSSGPELGVYRMRRTEGLCISQFVVEQVAGDVRAPASLAPCTTFSPTPPHPITSTLSPAATRA